MQFKTMTSRVAIPLPKNYWLCPPASKLKSKSNEDCTNQATRKNFQAYVCLRDMQSKTTGGMGRFVLNKACTQDELDKGEDRAMQPTLLVERSSTTFQVPFKDEDTLCCPPPGPGPTVLEFPVELREKEVAQRVLRKRVLVHAYSDPSICSRCKLRQSAKKCSSMDKLCSTCCRQKSSTSMNSVPCDRHKKPARSPAKIDARKCRGCNTHRPTDTRNHFAGACDYQLCRLCCEKDRKASINVGCVASTAWSCTWTNSSWISPGLCKWGITPILMIMCFGKLKHQLLLHISNRLIVLLTHLFGCGLFS